MDENINNLRRKYMLNGYDSLTDCEKIQLLISFSEYNRNVSEIARNIYENYGNICSAIDIDIFFLKQDCRINDKTEVLFKMIPALHSIIKGCHNEECILSTSDSAKGFFYSLLKKSNIEEFAMAVTDKDFHVRNCEVIFAGENNHVNILYDKIYYFIRKNEGEYVFIAHNHPEDCTMPSRNDIYMTAKLKVLFEDMGKAFVDHIIVSPESAGSMRQIQGEEKFSFAPSYIISSEL